VRAIAIAVHNGLEIASPRSQCPRRRQTFTRSPECAAMIAFAELLERLVFTPSRNAKVARRTGVTSLIQR
jgi:hypothetical protein